MSEDGIRVHRGIIRVVCTSVVVLGVAAGILSVFGSSFDLYVFNSILLAAVGALALNMLVGGAGQVSLGNAAFLALGAFSGIAALRAGVPFPFDVACGAIASALVGLVVGLPALRIKGLYLILATLAAHFIIIYFAEQYQAHTVGAGSFLIPRLYGSFGLRGLQEYWAWTLSGIVVAVMCGYKLLLSTKTGRMWQLVRYQENIAPALGVNPTVVKLTAFVISSAIVGGDGALMSHFAGSVGIDTFSISLAISYVAMIVIGGMNSIGGSLAGAVVVVGLPLVLPNLMRIWWSNGAAASQYGPNIAVILYGVLIVFFVVKAPNGIAGWARRVKGLPKWVKYFRPSRRRAKALGSDVSPT